MNFTEYKPIEPLQPYIRSYFHILINKGSVHLPSDGCPGILISLGEPFLLDNGEGHFKKISSCTVIGASNRYISAKAKGLSSIFIVKLMPGKMSQFFNIPGIELTDTSASLESILGTYGKELEERIHEAESVPELIQLLETVFIRQLSYENYLDKRISAALNTIIKNKGQVRIENLADRLDLSRRQLERNFLAAVGLTPKRLIRVVRFSSVFQHSIKNKKNDWADLALTCGYSDQAHLIRECRYFTNYSPKNYIKNIRSPFETNAHGFK